MLNTIVWGLENEISYHAIENLADEKRIAIKAWFGKKDKSTVVTHCWSGLQCGEFTKTQYMGCNEVIYSRVYSQLYTFIDMVSCNFPAQNRPIHEYLQQFNLLVDYFFEIMITEEVQLVIFGNIPHKGPDHVLYSLSRALGIKTLLMSQSLFADRFFYTFDTDDFGLFVQIPEHEYTVEQIFLRESCEKDLFCLEGMLTDPNDGKQTICAGKTPDWEKQLGSVWQRSLGICSELRGRIEDHLIRKLSIYHDRYLYKRRLGHRFSINAVDFQKKYIYFPLQLQPKMTTSALGGIYCDQLLALERLSEWIPEDWQIYVEENPKQTGFMRGKYFFERLQSIPKVQTLGPSFNTHELMDHCQFVATITGTAGWEAIRSGKPVVIFGKAWYLNLPGVFFYSPILSIETIMQYSIDHQELEAALAKLLKKTGRGVIDPRYAQLVSNFSIEDNNQKITSFFRYIIPERI